MCVHTQTHARFITQLMVTNFTCGMLAKHYKPAMAVNGLSVQ